LALNVWAQIIGKFITGFGVSLVLVAMTVYVCETLPGFLIGRCLTSINLGISFGYVISSVVQALTLPRPSSVTFETTSDWRVGFCTPMIVAGINLF
jgi:MFS family permease